MEKRKIETLIISAQTCLQPRQVWIFGKIRHCETDGVRRGNPAYEMAYFTISQVNKGIFLHWIATLRSQ